MRHRIISTLHPRVLVAWSFLAGDWTGGIALHWIGLRGWCRIEPRRGLYAVGWVCGAVELVRMPAGWNRPALS